MGADRETGFSGNPVSNHIEVSMERLSGADVVSGSVELIHDPFDFGKRDVLATPCQFANSFP